MFLPLQNSEIEARTSLVADELSFEMMSNGGAIDASGRRSL